MKEQEKELERTRTMRGAIQEGFPVTASSTYADDEDYFGVDRIALNFEAEDEGSSGWFANDDDYDSWV